MSMIHCRIISSAALLICFNLTALKADEKLEFFKQRIENLERHVEDLKDKTSEMKANGGHQ